MISPRVKSQARCQNNRLRALKLGIVHLFDSNGAVDMNEDKMCHFS